MNEIFVNDTVILKLNTYMDLEGYDLQVKYIKPDGSTGLWEAAIDPEDSEVLQANAEFDLAGTWQVQAYITDEGGVVLHGMWADVRAYNPLW